ncbi:unnamed protein product [Nezara viridula]|uniref:Uncharacterized protein n=1 Tax=Nezara viridula TaxID=85310 RepID=A0A9P0HA06_NEZVI|nr:unnamed protein product [Nezara viridula]
MLSSVGATPRCRRALLDPVGKLAATLDVEAGGIEGGGHPIDPGMRAAVGRWGPPLPHVFPMIDDWRPRPPRFLHLDPFCIAPFPLYSR